MFSVFTNADFKYIFIVYVYLGQFLGDKLSDHFCPVPSSSSQLIVVYTSSSYTCGVRLNAGPLSASN